ncbi:MAG: amino acid ABC transporter permease [Clostridiales bacterium]|nr:amino acid ABC transporter permease [Clostridiales bacterium]MDD2572485.1 amino acid ABC transporter permease [Eubacteriales bacterium]MDD3540125.1 amino acid ABC transporter permease [Eubacteriales bacterium]
MGDFMRRLSDAIYYNLIREQRYLQFLRGLGVSLQLTVYAAAIGILIGLFLALAKLGKISWLQKLSTLYVDIIRGTPMVVQLVLIYYAILGTSSLPKIMVASIAFGLNSGAYVSELIRAGIMALDKGQMEAARSLGFSYGKSMRYIVIPQAVKNILPALGNEFIVLLKETAIAGYIALDDLTRAGNIVRGRTFDAYTPFILVALIYLYITTILTGLLNKLERRMRASD